MDVGYEQWRLVITVLEKWRCGAWMDGWDVGGWGWGWDL